jgi:hypothetical protein
MSRATKVVLILATVLLLGAITGVLRAGRGVEVSQDEAVRIARTAIDFVPERTAVRLLRRGFAANPYWAVSFSVPGPDPRTHIRLTTVLVDARTGSIVEVHRSR